jgi:hypothetical protein
MGNYNTGKLQERRLNNRSEQRRCSFTEVKIKATNIFGFNDIDALIVDRSTMGVGILSYFPLLVSTRINIKTADGSIVAGEVVNVSRGQWGRFRVRMGIRLLNSSAFGLL